jgi:hypothetical protein
MNEAKVVRDVLTNLKRLLPGAVCFKHNDLSTAGIPDISINFRGRTTWIEVKLSRSEEGRSRFLRHFDRLQLASCILLERQVPAYYLVAFEAHTIDTMAALYSPKRVKACLTEQNDARGFRENLAWGDLSSVLNRLADIVRKD